MNSTIKICRLCLQTICGNDCDLIEDIIGQMLENLLKIDLNLSEDPLICKKCVVNLDKSVNFKTTCLNIVSLEESKSENDKDVYENHKLCQFCMRQIELECCIYLKETKENVFIADVIQTHIPELKFNLAMEVITCKSCFEAMQIFSSFVTKCLNVEDKIKKLAESSYDVSGQINLYDVQQLISKSTIKYEANWKDENLSETLYPDGGDVDLKREIKCEEFEEVGNLDVNIENEEIDIKPEQNESERLQEENMLPQTETNINLVKMGESSLKQPHKTPLQVLLVKYDETLVNKPLNPESVQKNILGRKVRQCKSFSFPTKYESCLTRRKLNHENCSHPTKNKDSLKRQRLNHNNSSEITVYQCEHCSFQTKLKGSLKTHLQIHKDPSEINMYHCEHCSFQTRVRGNLKRHLEIHKDPSEINMYQCEHCLFHSKHKSYLKRHMEVHKDPSEINMYQCEHCSHQTKYKHNLKHHLRKHENPSEINMYQCEHCSFQTKRKGDLNRHSLSHRNPSEINMYQCEQCSFQTKHKYKLTRHLKYKANLKTHLLIHKIPRK